MITRSGIQLGPLFIHFYGLIIMTGALLAAWLATRLAKRRGDNGELIWDALPWLLVAGIIGARLWHILTPPDSMKSLGLTTEYYFTHPLDALAIWKGGLGIPGAVIGGAIALFFYCRAKKVSFARWVDFITPGLALAQAIGRWGNFVNQEVYGAPTTLPWKIYIDPLHRIAGYQDVEYYHPLFLYESLYNLAIVAILLWVGKRFQEKLRDGDIFLFYMILYPIGRFFLEFLRLDPSSVGLLNANQTLMAVIVVAAIVIFFVRHRSGSLQSDAIPAPEPETPDRE
jgi:phosphatidylglycerol:prolipoprotein diacylglycerol transferase